MVSTWIAFLLCLLNSKPILSDAPSFPNPDFTLYHTKQDPIHKPKFNLLPRDEILSRVQDIVDRHPTFMKKEEKTRLSDNYSVTLPIVTVEPKGLSTDFQDKIRILISFGEHGREIITTELGLEFLKCFEDHVELNCIEESADSKELKDILSNSVLKIIPMENPNGRELFEKGKYCERKNGRGVDINRNWDIDYGRKEPDYDPSEEFPGEYAFSEPEASILKDLALEFSPHVWIGVHSGMCAMFMPYDHIAKLPKGKAAKAQYDILKKIHFENRMTDDCLYGSGGETVGYAAHGTATDYMYMVLNVPLAFTWEIYGDEEADYLDCYKAFNPTTDTDVKEILNVWIAAFFKLIHLLPSHPQIPFVQPISKNNTSVEEDIKGQSEKNLNFIKGQRTMNPLLRGSSTLSLIAVIPMLFGILIARQLMTKKSKKPRN